MNTQIKIIFLKSLALTQNRKTFNKINESWPLHDLGGVDRCVED
jgi:hypothetical protein